jgi:hypothetical protein
MGTRLRLALLMLTVLPDVMGPPNRPPGSNAKVSRVRPVPCPKANCGKGRWQNGNVYKCRQCGHTFNYCSVDDSYFPDSAAASHRHASG